MDGSAKSMSPEALEALRPRLYQAVKATLLAAKDPQDRRDLLDRWLFNLYQEGPREVSFPEELAEAREAAFQAGLARAMTRCRGYAGSWFAWDAPKEQWVGELERVVARVAQGDKDALEYYRKLKTENRKLGIPGPPLQTRILHLLRQRWCGDAGAPETFRVDEWLGEVGFISRELMEIGSWARRFHLLALLHQEGKAAPEDRRRAFEKIMTGLSQGQPLASLTEFILYLEGRLQAGETPSPGLEILLVEPEVFPSGELAALLLMLEEGLAYLQGRETPEVAARLAWLEARRDLLNLRDLMLLFLSQIRGKEPIPPPSEVLDLLQSQGFPIHRQDFRDDYRARLAPLTSLLATTALTLRLPLEPEDLTGNPQADLTQASLRAGRRRLRLQAFKEEALAFLSGRAIPLPQAELICPAARFAAAWLAGRKIGRGEGLEASALAREAGELLPPALVKLIRPRKGYELTHKSQLQRLLRQQAQAYQDAVARCRRLGAVANDHDDAVLFHLAAAQALAQHGDLETLSPAQVSGLEMPQVESCLEELARGLEVDLAPAAAPWWHELRGWLRVKLDLSSILAQGEGLEVPREEWAAAVDSVFEDLARQFYRLAAAQARSVRSLSPLPGDTGLLGWLAAWFTPERQAFREAEARRLLKTIEEKARRAVRDSYPLRVETREELESLIKYYLEEELQGRDLETYGHRSKLSELWAIVASRLDKCRIVPEVLPSGGMAAVIQELLRPRPPEATRAQRELEDAVLALLPRTDCGSCGSPGCLIFARLLVQGRARPGQCLQAPGEVKQRLEEVLAQAPPPALVSEPYRLTPDDRRLLAALLDPHTLARRQRLARELERSGQDLVPVKLDEVSILQIGKTPQAAAFHGYLENYLGFEAAQRLTRADRDFLVNYGEARLNAEARELEASLSWMEQERRPGLSGFALAELDPARQARGAYWPCLFLSDLSIEDQKRVQEFRLRQFLPDFLAQWERALPEHWQAGYRIEDWEDFSHIVAKSYWHQEHTPAPEELWRELPASLTGMDKLEELGNSYLEDLVQEQLAWLEKCRPRLEELLRRRQVESLADVDFLVQGVTAREWQSAAAESGHRLDPEERRARLAEEVFLFLDRANLNISSSLRVHWDELRPRVREIMAADSLVVPWERHRLMTGDAGLAWREMRTLRPTWLKALIQAAAERLLLAQMEVERFFQGTLPGPTPGTLRRAVRHLFWKGERSREVLLEKLGAKVAGYPEGRRMLGEAARAQLIWSRLMSRAFLTPEPEAEDLTHSLDGLLRARVALDLPKLRAYLFILARMEGDLDKLTALLREIRETADVIEAAWLAFTEERLTQDRASGEGAAAAGLVPLLASRLPDKERFSGYLKEGLPRGEPRDYTQAFWELMTILQFYVVTAGPQDSPEEMRARLEAGPYDLGGLDSQALLAALRSQAARRERLLPQKISICTYVLGSLLAGAHPSLGEREAEFLREKGAFLKTESLSQEFHKGDLAGARGVELGRLRNELYLRISDLLKEDRTESFARRIGQILERLEEERAATLQSFQRGELNRRTAFYILRRFQKDQPQVTPEDLGRFLRQYQPEKLAGLRERLAPEVAAEVDKQLEHILAGYRQALKG